MQTLFIFFFQKQRIPWLCYGTQFTWFFTHAKKHNIQSETQEMSIHQAAGTGDRWGRGWFWPVVPRLRWLLICGNWADPWKIATSHPKVCTLVWNTQTNRFHSLLLAWKKTRAGLQLWLEMIGSISYVIFTLTASTLKAPIKINHKQELK